MPNPTQTTLAELRQQIKREAKIEGAVNLDTWIDELINELLVAYAQSHRYPELLVLNHEIPAADNTAAYSLPTNFMVLRLVRYRFASRNLRVLNEQNGYVPNPPGCSPRYYVIAGNQINLTPSESIHSSEALVMDYYKYPDTLTASTSFPIPRIWTPLKREAIARAHVYHKQLQQAAALQASSGKIEAKAEGLTTG